MKKTSSTMTLISQYLQQSDALPSPQLRRLGLLYSGYRLIISIFFVVMSYVTSLADGTTLLPTVLSQTLLSIYVFLSLVLFNLFYVIKKHQHHQLTLGLVIDVVMLSLLLYTNGAPDLQLTLLYMVVVAASFMLLQSSQAVIITLLAIIFVIYQQFFYAIANSMSLTDLVHALLISFSFLAVGFLSWSVSRRLVQVEKMAAQQAQEVERLNDINQEVISQMMNGVMVIDKEDIVLANNATYQLLDISTQSAADAEPETSREIGISWYDSFINRRHHADDHPSKRPFIAFQQQMKVRHERLLKQCRAVAAGHSRNFIYELPTVGRSLVTDKLRVQIIPLKNNSQLVLLEDLRREQAGAQQLKLASLGQLTASIAHEIRNPLAAISQASQLLIEDADTSLDTYTDIDIGTAMGTEDTENLNNSASPCAQCVQTQNNMAGNYELYKMIFSQTKRVNNIIEDVLKLSRQQPPNQQTIAIADWTQQFLDNYFPNEVVLRLRAQPIIQFDTHQLEQILINLINNGLRYSRRVSSDAQVEIDIYCQQNDVMIDILDAGTGVATADLEQLFNPFFTTDKAGTGLGLYLSQAFSEANHAHLRYVPEHEKSCFRLIIPNAIADKADAEHTTAIS